MLFCSDIIHDVMIIIVMHVTSLQAIVERVLTVHVDTIGPDNDGNTQV